MTELVDDNSIIVAPNHGVGLLRSDINEFALGSQISIEGDRLSGNQHACR